MKKRFTPPNLNSPAASARLYRNQEIKKMSKNITSPNLDDLLLDIATAIELSDRDRQVAESRYRKLKEHLERAASPFAPYLADDSAHIYPQGSVATGTTIVSGTEEERFDLDAMVEVKAAAHLKPKQALDLLFEALKDFPDAVDVVRCTRCVQIKFAFMHMDVSIMLPSDEPRIQRAGELFHSCDKGVEKLVPTNPYGFAAWFRANTNDSHEEFHNALVRRRSVSAIDRFESATYAKSVTIYANDAKQDDLPAILPSRHDSEQSVALKLLKRYINLRYEGRDMKKPPSIYLAKLAADVDVSEYGLCAQLAALANHIHTQMGISLATGKFPDERNPSYAPDKLNDRWPKERSDMEVLSTDMSALLSSIDKLRNSGFKQIATDVVAMFGERVSKLSVAALLERAAAPEYGHKSQYERGTGATILSGAVVAPAVARSLAQAPRQNFHCGIAKKKGK
jgi:Second Messenger Oligonucleotide or Dinucleotide Synthetase domain